MVREGSVRLRVERGVGNREPFEHLRFPRAHAVGEVAGEADGPLEVGVLADEGGVFFADVGLRHRAGRRGLRREGFLRDDALDVGDARRARNRDRALAAELEAVVLLGVVRGGDHHRSVATERTVAEVTDRRRGEPQIDHVGAELRRAAGERFEERDGGRADVAGDRDFLAGEEGDERACDVVGDLGRELGAVYAADVVSFEDAGHGFLSGWELGWEVGKRRRCGSVTTRSIWAWRRRGRRVWRGPPWGGGRRCRRRFAPARCR